MTYRRHVNRIPMDSEDDSDSIVSVSDTSVDFLRPSSHPPDVPSSSPSHSSHANSDPSDSEDDQGGIDLPSLGDGLVLESEGTLLDDLESIWLGSQAMEDLNGPGNVTMFASRLISDAIGNQEDANNLSFLPSEDSEDDRALEHDTAPENISAFALRLASLGVGHEEDLNNLSFEVSEASDGDEDTGDLPVLASQEVPHVAGDQQRLYFDSIASRLIMVASQPLPDDLLPSDSEDDLAPSDPEQASDRQPYLHELAPSEAENLDRLSLQLIEYSRVSGLKDLIPEDEWAVEQGLSDSEAESEDHPPLSEEETEEQPPILESSDSGDDFEEPDPVRASTPRASEGPVRPHVLRPEIVTGNPKYWLHAFSDIDTLLPRRWCDIKVLDFYLLHYWLSHPSPKMRYMEGWRFALPEERDIEHKTEFRQTFSLPLEGPCPLQVVTTTITVNAMHHFVVVFDPANNGVLILGRHWLANEIADRHFQRWEEFYGPILMKKLIWLHDWPDMDTDKVSKYWESWEIFDGECGTRAVVIQEQLIDKGLVLNAEADGLVLDFRECGHRIRLRMVHTLHQAIFSSYAYYAQTQGNHPLHWEDAEMVDNDGILENVSKKSLSPHAHVIKALDEAEKTCSSCIRRFRYLRPLVPLRAPSPVPIPPSLQASRVRAIANPLGERRRARLRKLMLGHPELKRFRLRGSEPHADSDGDDEGTGEKTAPSNEETGERDNDPDDHVELRRLPTWSTWKGARHPDAIPPVALPEMKTRKFIKHNDWFDEYYLGPTIEEMPVIPESRFMAFFLQAVAWSCWTTFRDYGYRLLPSFHQSFYLEPPSAELVREHFLTVGLVDWDPKTQMSDHINGEYTLNRNLGDDIASEISDRVRVSDVLVVGMKDMLDMVSNTTTPLANTTVFLAGRTPEWTEPEPDYPPGKHLCLDLEIDAVSVATPDIEISTDIDSLIWVGREIMVKNAVSLHMGPTVGRRPPIAHHNGCYADMLAPRSDEDKARGGRSEWLQRHTPLVTIPHTILFEVTSGLTSSILFGYIFFPRMQHRHEYTGRWMTIIPFLVQNMFWNEIVLPALAQCAKSQVELTYMPPTVDYHLYRTRTDGRPTGDYSKLKHERVTAEQLITLQRLMREKVDSNPERYNLYGSFFIVLEAKGIKKQTRTVHNVLHPWEALTATYQDLDFDYLRDRTKGELFLDLGVTMTPSRNVGPLVGLWRTEPTVASYQSSGFLTGTRHSACQLGRYGGMQAEMELKRSMQTHITKSISYNLEYEVTRPVSGKATQIDDSNAYHLKEPYTRYCQRRIEQYQASHGKSYGCRVEYRMGGESLYALCSEPAKMLEKITDFIDSKPMIWIDTKSWFDFLAARLKAVWDAQKHLHRSRPRNYGVMTSVLTMMLYSIGNTTQALPTYTREALRNLNMNSVTHRFGLFFLQNLHLEEASISEAPLREIDFKDSLEVLVAMKVSATVGPPRRPLIEAHDPIDPCPLGPNPSWSQVEQSISSNPLVLMRLWTFEASMQHITKTAADLFILFTWQMWSSCRTMYLTNDWRPSKEITLEDAMRLWSAVEVHEHLDNVEWRATKTAAALEGNGRPAESFRSRWSMYFPSKASAPAAGPWKVLFKAPWYISQYHQVVETSDDDTVAQLHDDLGNLFDSLQCLPDSMRCGSNAPGRTWWQRQNKIVILTNPEYYRYDKAVAKSRVRRARFPSGNANPKEQQQNLYEAAGLSLEEQDEIRRSKRREEYGKSRNKYRSAKSKNARRPPAATRRERQPAEEPSQPVLDSSIDLEDEPENGNSGFTDAVERDQDDVEDTMIEIFSSSEEDSENDVVDAEGHEGDNEEEEDEEEEENEEDKEDEEDEEDKEDEEDEEDEEEA